MARRKAYRGTSAEHRKAERFRAHLVKLALENVRLAVKDGRCDNALAALVDASEQRGEQRAHGDAAGLPGKGHVNDYRIDIARRLVQKRCVIKERK